MNIVLVEDSPAIRRLLDRNLRSVEGVHVVGEAATEAEAVQVIREQRPDLVLLDLSLSTGKGINVLRQLRSEGATCKVLVLTNQPLDIYRAQCLALGADGFYDKATDISIVMNMVREWIAERSASHDALLNSGPSSPMGLRDALTALPTRSALLERLDLALRIARRDGHGLAVFVGALDDLDAIRRHHGIERSDDLLAQAGARLSEAFERSDVVARVADDAFSVVITRVDSDDEAVATGQRIVDLLEPAYLSGGAIVQMTSGVGMSLFPQNGSTAQALLSLADHRARQSAAAHKPALVRIHTTANPDGQSLLPRLREAIGTPAISLAFQPQCDVDSGLLSGVEALARWTDPARGAISPAQFVTLAEENGLIDELSNHLFATALAERNRLIDAGTVMPRLALNVSALQVRPALIDLWAELLERYDTLAADIELEFTETAVLSDGPEVSRTLRTLRDMGFSLALDDFGVGYSSLSMLQRLPINTLKIDRSFIADIEQSTRSAAIVGSMIRLAQGLNIRVIAEGVEREQQLGILKNMGCHEMQGYLLARPLVGPAFSRWIERHHNAPWAYAQAQHVPTAV